MQILLVLDKPCKLFVTTESPPFAPSSLEKVSYHKLALKKDMNFCFSWCLNFSILANIVSSYPMYFLLPLHPPYRKFLKIDSTLEMIHTFGSLEK